MIKKLLFPLIALMPFGSFAQKIKILFLGNSYTYVNDLPQTLHDLALSKGDTILYDVNAIGGYRFVDHLSDVNSLAKINLLAWDYVVLQDQSQWPAFPPSQVASGVYPYAKRLDSLIHVNNNCTETIFYMTWGRKNGDTSNCSSYAPLCTFNGMNARLRESYLQMTQDNHASLSPVGIAWKTVRDSFPAINLYQSDESHPVIQGTYLAACVFYATLFHKTPVGAGIAPGVLANEGLQLQATAAHTVLDSLSNWQQYGDMPNANFNVSANNNQAQFTSLSANANSYQWHFGDNTGSTQANPAHTYTATGQYVVSLTASNNCKSFTVKDTVVITALATGINTYKSNDTFLMSPNPASDEVIIEAKNTMPSHLKIVNTLGEIIFETQTFSNKEKINISTWPRGFYFVSSSTENGITVKALIKN